MTRLPRSFWAFYIPLVLLLGAYDGLNQTVGLSAVRLFAPWQPVVWGLTSVYVIGALVPFVIALEDRIRVDSRPRWRTILVHLGGALVFSLVHTCLMVLARKLAYALAGKVYHFGDPLVQGFYELQKDLITYGTVLLVMFAIREFRIRRAGELRSMELASELSEARLRHLTTQIEPHFLFNSLNAISNRMHEDVWAADRMISQLGDLLRAAYESDRHLMVPLERELGWLRGYSAMMAERFRGQLIFEIEVEPGLETTQVPRLLLQPLVENALRHGLPEGRGRLRVDVRRNGGRLRYVVSDDGAGLPDQPVTRGTGLSNIERRLELLFPGDHTLDLASGSPRGAVVTVDFPAAGAPAAA